MVIKKLREQKQWSQEQLSILSGISIRTIQRIEAGNRASLESLKALASVFETDIETLQKEIIVIDKTTEEWKSRPWWYRLNMLGIKDRKNLIAIEAFSVGLGILFWIAGFYSQGFLIGAGPLFFSAYIAALTVRKGDKDRVW